MAMFSGLWNTSLTQSNNWINANQGPAALVSSASAGSQSGGISGAGPLSVQSLASPQNPLNTLLNHVSLSMSAVAFSNPSTQNLNLGPVFSSAFSTPAYQQSSPLTPVIASQSITNLVSGIMNQTLNSAPMNQQQQAALFLSLLSGVNMGFLSASNTLQLLNQWTAQIGQTLNQTQWLTQQSLGNYYSNAALSSPAYAPQAQQPAAQSQTQNQQTTVQAQTQQQTTQAATGTGQAQQQSGTVQATQAAAAQSSHPILNDPAVQALLNDIQNNPQQYPISAAYSDPATGTQITYYMDNFESPDGTDHNILDVWINNSAYTILDYGAQVINGSVWNQWAEARKSLDAEPLLNVEDPAGNTHQIQSIYQNGTVADVEVNGAAMNSQQLVQWAQNNNLKTKDLTVNGQAVREYWIESQTPMGNKSIVIAAEVNGQAFNRQQYLYEQNSYGYTYGFSNLDSFITDMNGNAAHLIASSYYDYATNTYVGDYMVNGQEMNVGDFLDWADNNMNFQKVTFAHQGNTVEEYWANETVAGGTQKVKMGARINGVAQVAGWGPDKVELIKSSTGNYYEYYGAALTDANNNINGYYTMIDGAQMSSQDLVNWAQTNNLQTRTLNVNGHTVTEYQNINPSYPSWGGTDIHSFNIVAAEIDGQAYNRMEYMNDPNHAPDVYDSGYDATATPIVLDLDGDGISTVAAEEGVEFDLLGTGQKVQTGWVAGDDALLALDRDKSGAIESGKELFGNQRGAAHGYEELAKFDENKDSVIDEKDAVYADLRVWQDRDRDGVSDEGELRSLKEAGVASISAVHTDVNETDAAGNQIRQRSTFTLSDGTIGNTADVWFRYNQIVNYWKQQTSI